MFGRFPFQREDETWPVVPAPTPDMEKARKIAHEHAHDPMHTHYICGDANPNGNVQFTYRGGCRKQLCIVESYRCTGCGGRFHRDCIFNHFQQELKHSRAHNALRRIKALMLGHGAKLDKREFFKRVKVLCDFGLSLVDIEYTKKPTYARQITKKKAKR